MAKKKGFFSHETEDESKEQPVRKHEGQELLKSEMISEEETHPQGEDWIKAHLNKVEASQLPVQVQPQSPQSEAAEVHRKFSKFSKSSQGE